MASFYEIQLEASEIANTHQSVADPGIQEKGFMLIKGWRFALLILSYIF